MAVALRKAKAELGKLDRLAQAKRISRSSLEQRINKTLAREHLSSFVVTEIDGSDKRPTLRWHVDAALRRQLENTRLGRRVLCTDRHLWSTGRIVYGFRGQWNVEELFRRAKKGGVVPWGPSHQWADGSLRLHTFATVLGLMLVSLAKIALGTGDSALAMMGDLAEIRATMVRTREHGAQDNESHRGTDNVKHPLHSELPSLQARCGQLHQRLAPSPHGRGVHAQDLDRTRHREHLAPR